MSKQTGLKWIGLLLCMLIAFPSWSEVYYLDKKPEVNKKA